MNRDKEKMNPLRDRLRSIRDGTAEPPPIARTLGITLVEIGEGIASATMKVDARYYNPMGTVHGGILTDLADLSMGVAVGSLLKDDESFTTIRAKDQLSPPCF